MFALSIIAIIVPLLFLHDREPPFDPHAPPTGPSTLIRRLRQTATARQIRDRQSQALALDHLLFGDAGPPEDAGTGP
jgi:hypothetical protein